MNNIPTIQFSNGKLIPALGIGTWKLNGTECRAALSHALDAGYRHIDTATVYENEAVIGEVLKEKNINRSDLFITSKLWFDEFGEEETVAACQASINALGCEYLDLYLMHWPISSADMKGAFVGFKKLLDAGLVRSVGVSNFTISHLEKILPLAEELGVPIVNNQVEFHPGLNQAELLDYCKSKDIVITAYSPLGRGKIFDHPDLESIAQAHNKSVAQICLIWLLQKGMVVIPKASSKEHLQSNMDIFDTILSQEDLDRIDAMGNAQRLVVPSFAEFV